MSAGIECPIANGTGDHGACARDRECSVDRQSEVTLVRGSLVFCAIGFAEGGGESRYAGPGRRRDIKHWRTGKRGACQERFDLLADFGDAFCRTSIAFGDSDDAASDAEEIENLYMLHGLRHDAVIGGHDDQREVDATHASEHVANVTFVAGHVDEPDRRAVLRWPIGETQVDGDAACAFFRQPIGRHSGERPDQRGFAVIDVTCGRDEHAATI